MQMTSKFFQHFWLQTLFCTSNSKCPNQSILIKRLVALGSFAVQRDKDRLFWDELHHRQMLFFVVEFLYKFILEEFQIYHLLGLTKQVDVDVTVACCFLFWSPTQLLSNAIVGVYATEEAEICIKIELRVEGLLLGNFSDFFSLLTFLRHLIPPTI